LTEIKRVQQYGFTSSELQRLKTQVMRNIEQAFRERDKFYSGDLADEIIRNYLQKESVPGIEFEYELYKKYLPEISLEEINAQSAKWISDKGRVVLVSSPEKPTVQNPTESELAAIFKSIDQKSVGPYVDQVADRELVEPLPTPGQIVSEVVNDSLGTTELLLSNGIRVIVKPTDFKNDEILLSAYSPGGTSLVPDSNYIAAVTSIPIVNESGLGDFNEIELTNKLSGKVLSVTPTLTELTENISASASPTDLETMFQVIYLYFTASRADSSSYLAYRERLRAMLSNRAADPKTAFSDTVNTTLTQYHFRARPWSLELMNEMELKKSAVIFKERFANASDFTFFLVGNIQVDSIKPLVLRYLASLPNQNRQEQWRDVGIRPPTGIIKKEVHKGLEKQSFVQLTFTGPFEFNRLNRFELMSVGDILRIKLREKIREEKGGTYGVQLSNRPSNIQPPNTVLRSVRLQSGSGRRVDRDNIQ
jgi:zinc protease